MNKKILFSGFALVLLGFSNQVFSQNIGINGTGAAPAASAGLDVSFTNKGLLIPRVALTATNAAGPIAAPATSLLVYNTATAGAGATAVTPGYYYWDGAAWVRFSTGGDDWKINGNANATSGTHFLGTTNAQALDFRTNNTIRFRVANANQVHAVLDGTNALPFYSFTNNTNMGMYRVGADILGFATSGVERFRMSATEAVFNDISNDYDFRIESNNQANAFFVDGGNDVIGFSGVPVAPFELGLPVHSMYYPFEVGNDGNSGDQIAIGYYRASDPTLNPEQNGGWGYVGYNAVGPGNNQYWWRGYSGGWINVSQRELKRDIVEISSNESVESFMIKSILNIKPSLYNYNNEENEMKQGLENHYRPAYRIGLIADESPDFILDESFSGVDIYGLATLSLLGAQYSIKEINTLKKIMKVQDFGTDELQGKEIWIYFSEDFKGITPVITLTNDNPNVQLNIVEKNDKGFKVIASRIDEKTNFDWIAIAKIEYNDTNSDTNSLNDEVLNKLIIPTATRRKILDFYEDFKPSVSHPTLK